MPIVDLEPFTTRSHTTPPLLFLQTGPKKSTSGPACVQITAELIQLCIRNPSGTETGAERPIGIIQSTCVNNGAHIFTRESHLKM